MLSRCLAWWSCSIEMRTTPGKHGYPIGFVGHVFGTEYWSHDSATWYRTDNDEFAGAIAGWRLLVAADRFWAERNAGKKASRKAKIYETPEGGK